jgi:hypothetical protein
VGNLLGSLFVPRKSFEDRLDALAMGDHFPMNMGSLISACTIGLFAGGAAVVGVVIPGGGLGNFVLSLDPAVGAGLRPLSTIIARVCLLVFIVLTARRFFGGSE